MGRLLVSAGISIIAGKLSAAIEITVQSTNTHYDFHTYDIITNHHEELTGVKYVITDTKYLKYKDQIYYEDFCPEQWGKTVLANELNGRLFGFNYFNVVSWY